MTERKARHAKGLEQLITGIRNQECLASYPKLILTSSPKPQSFSTCLDCFAPHDPNASSSSASRSLNAAELSVLVRLPRVLILSLPRLARLFPVEPDAPLEVLSTLELLLSPVPNQLRRLEAFEEASSCTWDWLSLFDDEPLIVATESVRLEFEAERRSRDGLLLGVGADAGVASPLVISTSSASRYHLRRRV